MDPLSLAASVAGLIAVVGKAAEISQSLYKSVKKNPQLLKRLADELDTFQKFLVELRQHIGQDAAPDGDPDALRMASSACYDTVEALRDHLVSLQEMFSKTTLRRMLSRSKFVDVMEEIDIMTDALSAHKLTLSTAMHLKDMTQTSALKSDFTRLQIALEGLTLAVQSQSGPSFKDPFQKYIDISRKITRERQDESQKSESVSIQSSQFTTSLETIPLIATASSTTSISQEAKADLEKVQTFGSFEDWLNSFTPTAPIETQFASNEANSEELLKDQRVKLQIKFPATDSSDVYVVESIDLAMRDRFYEAIQQLEDRGYKNIRGFRWRDEILSPFSRDGFIPIQVTTRLSSYATDWPEVNINESLQQFYNDFATADFGEQLNVSLEDNYLNIWDLWHRCGAQISMDRTLRLPEDDKVYEMPQTLGQFPLINMNLIRDKLPSGVEAKQGVIIPMFTREAVSVHVEPMARSSLETMPHLRRILTDKSSQYSNQIYGGYPGKGFAMRIYAGGINVLSGCLATDVNNQRPQSQDYVLSTQGRLDGFLAPPKNGRSTIRQFVGMPAGQGYSVESQITGAEVINGLQVMIAPHFVGDGVFAYKHPDRNHKRRHFNFNRADIRELILSDKQKSPFSMGITPGSILYMGGDEAIARKKDGQMVTEIMKNSLSIGALQNRDVWLRTESQLRPVSTYEGISPALEHQYASGSLILEPLYDMTLILQTDKYMPVRDRKPQKTWKVSPFLTGREFKYLVGRSLGLCGGEADISLENMSTDCHIIEDRALHEFCSDLDIICVRLPAQEYLCGVSHGEIWVPRAPTKPCFISGWELGVASGGSMYQNVYSDENLGSEQWNWPKARIVSVQIINAMGMKSLVGFDAPDPPISWADYVAARLPFSHVLSTATLLLGEDTWSLIHSISEIDADKGVARSSTIKGADPVACIVCDMMLADTILRPCNHVFCSKCANIYREDGAVVCCVCHGRPSHQIQFSGPMETPNEDDCSIDINTKPSRLLKIGDRPMDNSEFTKIVARSIRGTMVEQMTQDVAQTRLRDHADDSNTPFSHAAPTLLDYQDTMLQLAIRASQPHKVKALLESRQTDAVDRVSSLDIAASEGRLHMVKQLLPLIITDKREFVRKKYAVHGTQAEAGLYSSALHEAAANGHTETIRLLLDNGFDPNEAGFCDSRGKVALPGTRAAVPLVWAAANNQVQAARILLEVTQFKHVQPAIHAAIFATADETLKVFDSARIIVHISDHVRPSLIRNILLVEDANVQLSSMATLLKYGVEAEEVFRHGIPQHVETFTLLWPAGYHADEKAVMGRKLLVRVASIGNVAIGTYLLDHGVSPDVGLEHGRSPLREAFQKGQSVFASLLLSRGASPYDATLLRIQDPCWCGTSSLCARQCARHFLECFLVLFPYLMPLFQGQSRPNVRTDAADLLYWRRQLERTALKAVFGLDPEDPLVADLVFGIQAVSPSCITEKTLFASIRWFYEHHPRKLWVNSKYCWGTNNVCMEELQALFSSLISDGMMWEGDQYSKPKWKRHVERLATLDNVSVLELEDLLAADLALGTQAPSSFSISDEITWISSVQERDQDHLRRKWKANIGYLIRVLPDDARRKLLAKLEEDERGDNEDDLQLYLTKLLKE